MSTVLLWASAVAAVAAFAAAFVASGLVGVARRAGATAQDSVRALSDPSLDDDAKEQRARAAALHLFKAFAAIALRSALVLLAPLAVLWAFDMSGLVPLDAAIDFLTLWEVLLATTVFGIGLWLAFRAKR